MRLRLARSSLIYLDQVRQGSSYAQATNDPNYLPHNSREHHSQRALLAQTDIAIEQARQFGHTDTADALVMV
ncbi:hypothetical protein [Streptomyces hokutonensis]|uniref:hypothetical protein n=1 Tax=Streptomyces hokutonensis TaxID=1306990 RepID=UPI003809E711